MSSKYYYYNHNYSGFDQQTIANQKNIVYLLSLMRHAKGQKVGSECPLEIVTVTCEWNHKKKKKLKLKKGKSQLTITSHESRVIFIHFWILETYGEDTLKVIFTIRPIVFNQPLSIHRFIGLKLLWFIFINEISLYIYLFPEFMVQKNN